MTSGFTKLFNSIITSSIWSEDDKVRIMWITFLAASDAKGFVSGTIPGMAAIARMSIPEAEQAIQKLESPDPYSRSNKREGARVIKCNEGWCITNYLKYRQKRDPEKRRKQNREAQRRYKEKQKANQSKQKASQNKPESAQAEAEAEAEAEEKKYSPLDLELSKLLFKLILKNRPGHPEPNFEKWADEVRKLREIDKKTPEQIKAVIEYAQADEFWWDKVLSTASLRKKSKEDNVKRVNRIEIQMQKGRNGNNRNNNSGSTEPFIR